jgi:hypothetical protein
VRISVIFVINPSFLIQLKGRAPQYETIIIEISRKILKSDNGGGK